MNGVFTAGEDIKRGDWVTLENGKLMLRRGDEYSISNIEKELDKWYAGDTDKIKSFYRAKIEELLSEMVVEEERMKPAIQTRSDAGAGYVIGANAARAEQLTKLNQLIK